MSDLFHSPRLTLNRAHHHIRDLESLINGFIREKPWETVVDLDLNPGKEVHKLRFTKAVPDGFACIVFDAVNNLRAALDQSGYASAVASGATTLKKTNFPFADDLIQLNSAIDGKRKVCRDLPPEIIYLFRGFNPYKGGDDTLWAVNKLCNTKKHCSLAPMRIGSITFRAQGKNGNFPNFSPACIPAWDAIKKELILFSTDPGESADVTVDPSITIAFDELGWIQAGRSAVAVLNDMASIVECILMATEGECRRLGFIA